LGDQTTRRGHLRRAGGIGRAAAVEFAAHGFVVAVRDPLAVAAVIDEMERQLGPIEITVPAMSAYTTSKWVVAGLQLRGAQPSSPHRADAGQPLRAHAGAGKSVRRMDSPWEATVATLTTPFSGNGSRWLGFRHG